LILTLLGRDFSGIGELFGGLRGGAILLRLLQGCYGLCLFLGGNVGCLPRNLLHLSGFSELLRGGSL